MKKIHGKNVQCLLKLLLSHSITFTQILLAGAGHTVKPNFIGGNNGDITSLISALPVSLQWVKICHSLQERLKKWDNKNI